MKIKKKLIIFNKLYLINSKKGGKEKNPLKTTFDETNRIYDVSFAGNVGYDDLIISHHRVKAAKIVSNIPNSFVCCFSRKNTWMDLLDFNSQIRLSPYQYDDLMRKTKVVVSPWGRGEFCYRDFEAIYHGSLLVKPDSDHILSYPDIHKDGIYYKCKSDLSNLKEVVDIALNDWDKSLDLRKENRKMLNQSIVDFPDRIKDFLEKVLDGDR